jgi:hypothetical protein
MNNAALSGVVMDLPVINIYNFLTRAVSARGNRGFPFTAAYYFYTAMKYGDSPFSFGFGFWDFISAEGTKALGRAHDTTIYCGI